MSEPIHVISLGAGVQSSTMALMAAKGEIGPMPRCAIFADTQDEPQEVYVWLEELECELPFRVIRVTHGRLSDAIVNKYGHSEIPAWRNGSLGKRQCTRWFKIDPIHRETRRLYGLKQVTLWQGISLDEVIRMKPSRIDRIVHKWPLIEARMTRHDCERWLRAKGYRIPPKSACVYCPYRSDAQWRESLTKKYDMEIIRKVEATLIPRGEFVHRGCTAIEKADLRTDEDRGQQVMFGNECEGMCGV